MASHSLRIAFLNCKHYDYLTATLIEGLNELQHEIYSSEASNYGRRLEDAAWRAFAESANVIVIGSNEGVRYSLLNGISNDRRVYLDSSDYQELSVPNGLGIRLVFKRELNRQAPDQSGILPMPFAAEKRYFEGASTIRDLEAVFLANLAPNPLRYSIYYCLLAMGRNNIILGSTGERAYDPDSPDGGPLETPIYCNLLRRAKIAVNVPGYGYDCARYWEILAAGAMLLTWEPDIWIPEPFVDGIHCATFRSLDEFKDKIEYYLARPEICSKVAMAGTQHLLQYHTTKARALWFVTQLERHGLV